MTLLPAMLRELRPTLSLAVPIVVGQVSQTLMGITDSVMIGRVGKVPLADLGKRLEGIQQATFKLYSKMSRMLRRQLITNGMYVYYIDMILPHLRLAGTYEKACTDLNFWEIDQRVSNYYYDITKRGFAQATVPQKIFSGEGYLPFGEKADRRRSKYFWS